MNDILKTECTNLTSKILKKPSVCGVRVYIYFGGGAGAVENIYWELNENSVIV